MKRKYQVNFYPHGGVEIHPFVPLTRDEMECDEDGELVYGFNYDEAVRRVIKWYQDQALYFALLDEEEFNYDPIHPTPSIYGDTE